MSGYVKLFPSILNSTVWSESLETRVVWITLLALSDRDGNVHARAPGIARAAGVTRDACDAALARLSAPDPDSRTKDHDGRRIEETDEGYRLINYEAYRDRESAEEKARKHAERQARYRERLKARDAKASTPERHVTPCDRSDRSDTLISSHLHLNSSASQLNSTDTDPDCEGVQAPPVATRRKRSPPKDPMGQQIASSAAWDAYRVAYLERYRAEPLRNAKVNGQLASLCKRLPVDSLPRVVSAYVRSQNARYVAAGHPVGLLLADAEAMHTEAITGRSRTSWGARDADKRDGRAQDYEDLFAELREHDKRKAEGKALQ